MSVREISVWENMHSGNCPLENWPSEKCLRGTVFRGNVRWRNAGRGTALEQSQRIKVIIRPFFTGLRVLRGLRGLISRNSEAGLVAHNSIY